MKNPQPYLGNGCTEGYCQERHDEGISKLGVCEAKLTVFNSFDLKAGYRASYGRLHGRLVEGRFHVGRQ